MAAEDDLSRACQLLHFGETRMAHLAWYQPLPPGGTALHRRVRVRQQHNSVTRLTKLAGKGDESLSTEHRASDRLDDGSG